MTPDDLTPEERLEAAMAQVREMMEKAREVFARELEQFIEQQKESA